MKNLILITGLICLTSFHIEAQTKSANSNSKFMIRHTVVFKLNCPKGSLEEKEFLSAAVALSSIPGVHNFESLRQTSPKNDFDYGLTMEFYSQKAYDEYTQHPDHIKFVQTYWGKYVNKFLEIDYEPIK
jgi:heme-degrading monooxygenase HmoA